MGARAVTLHTAGLAMAELPVPWGWFAVGFSHELRPGRVLTRRLAGRELVLWRGADGGLGASDATPAGAAPSFDVPELPELPMTPVDRTTTSCSSSPAIRSRRRRTPSTSRTSLRSTTTPTS